MGSIAWVGEIPCAESVRLKEIPGESAELWLIDGAGHAETMHNSDYEARLRKFFGIEGSLKAK